MVGCNEVKCVNLIVPQAKTCAREFIHPLVTGALSEDVASRDIQIALRTIMRAVGVQKEELVHEIERNIEHFSAIAETKDILAKYKKTKETLMAIPITIP